MSLAICYYNELQGLNLGTSYGGLPLDSWNLGAAQLRGQEYHDVLTRPWQNSLSVAFGQWVLLAP